MRLKGKKALITGAGGGIGHEICCVFSKEGAEVICADIDQASLNHTVSTIEQNAGTAFPVIGDLADENHVIELVKRSKEKFGGLDIVVSCAIKDVSYLPVTELPLAEWTSSINVNLTGVFLLLKYAIPLMAEGGEAA